MINKEIKKLLKAEIARQNKGIELIASENYPSKDVMKLCGSAFMWKYAEGYPNKRYYGGCVNVDSVESLAISLACKVFKCKFANVQAHSGSQANAEAYRALEKLLIEKDQLKDRKMKILSMDLNSGSHLTHGSPVSFSSNLYDFAFFNLGADGKISFKKLQNVISKEKPDVVLCGYSAYPFEVNFSKFRQLIDYAETDLKKEIFLMVDMAHIAGLVAAGEHPSPFPYADIVTTTTHKTLRGPRGGVIMCKKEFAADIDRAVFPGMQGGPLMHIIAAKAQCFYEVQQPEFKDYAKQIIKNAKAMEKVFKEESFRLVAGGTDNHLLLVDVKASCGISGKKAQRLLDEINITANKNAIPFDTEKPFKASGIRIGTPAMTTKGFKEEDFEEVARIIAYRLKNEETDEIKEECLKRVAKLTEKVTMYSNIKYI